MTGVRFTEREREEFSSTTVCILWGHKVAYQIKKYRHLSMLADLATNLHVLPKYESAEGEATAVSEIRAWIVHLV